MSSKSLSPLKAARWQKILDAAQALFAAQGFRGTTMEGIAAAAGMSKTTLYSYASDKDAVFAAVAERLADQLQEAVEAALSGAGSACERVEAALIAKHRIVHDLVRRSPFARELFAEKDRTSDSRFVALDRSIKQGIAALLCESDSDEDHAARLAALLFNASQGIANGGAEFAVVEQDIRLLVRALVQHEPGPRS